MRHDSLLCTVLTILTTLTAQDCMGLGMETFGNRPLVEGNYTDWKGIMPSVNDSARVYSSWVNGNEHFWYKGKTTELNAALANFARIEMKQHEVLLRPGPGIGHAFDKQKVPHNWELHILGGISKDLLMLDKGDQVWNKDPRLTIYMGDGIDLEDLEIPEGITLIDIHSLSQRVADGMTVSRDKTVRGWGCGVLASLDPFSDENLHAVARRVDDGDDWVRLNAVGSLPKFRKKAVSQLPALRRLLLSTNAELKASAQTAIVKIEQAIDNTTEEKAFTVTKKEIAEFLAKWKPSP